MVVVGGRKIDEGVDMECGGIVSNDAASTEIYTLTLRDARPI